MRHLITPRAPRELPTGPNPLPPLREFTVFQNGVPVAIGHKFGHYNVIIDPVREVATFEREDHTYSGHLVLCGRVLVSSDHLLPRDVQLGMLRVGYEVAR